MTALTPAQASTRITALLAATESRTLDFKRISSKHSRMYEAMCAFANTDGGLLVIGVGEMSDWQHPDLQPVADEQVLAFTRKG